MGRRGPRPQPTTLKVLHGNPGKRALNHDEPQPPPASLDAPAGLGEIGSEVWSVRAPLLSSLGLFTESDRGALHTYCRAHDEIARCDRVLAEEGNYFTTEKGFVGCHPAVGERFKWLEIKRRYEAEFGLTPSSRSGLKVEKPKETGVMSRKRA